MQFDIKNKVMRATRSIFGFHIGKWEPFPEFEYIAVVKMKGTSLSESFFAVNLFYNLDEFYTFYKTTNKEEALHLAASLKSELDIDILDATGKERKWLIDYNKTSPKGGSLS